MVKNKVHLVYAGLLAALPGIAFALDGVELDGFLTVGATLSDANIDSQDGFVTDNLGFEKDTRVGLQVSAEVNEQINLTAQLLGRARENNYNAFFDWGFVDYRFNDNFTLRAGKLKFPTFLISDYYEVGYAYPWIRPPEEVYVNNPISTLSGVDLLSRYSFQEVELLVQPYVGTSTGASALIPQESLAGAGLPAGTVAFTDFQAENLMGINTSLTWEKVTVRAGYLQTDVSVDAFAVTEDKAQFSSVGATVDWNNVVVYSEYAKRDVDGKANSAFPNQEGWYTTFGYRFGQFLPHLTYAKLDDADNPTAPASCGGVTCGTPLQQDSVTAGLRVELGDGAALKMEVQNVDPETGTRGLFISDPGDANIYSLAIDVVF